MAQDVEVRTAWSGAMILGEGVTYSGCENALYWVDIKYPALHRLSLATNQYARFEMPDYLGWVIERQIGGWIGGLRHGIAHISLDPFQAEYVVRINQERPNYRLNDAKAHRNGSIYFGTMDNDEQEAGGALYRFAPDGSLTLLDEGYRVTNGPAFSLDGRKMYTPDSALGVVYCFDVRDDGGVTNKREFIRIAPSEGYPDGMTVDAEDHLWIALWGGACVRRYRPNATLERTIAIPAPNVTSCAFGGLALNRLFVTTATIGMPDSQRQQFPLAGSLFEVDAGVTGVAAAKFGG